MRIDAWSDIVCPWCAVGKAHLEQALSRFEHAADVELVWRSFELDPGARQGDGRRLAEALERAGVPARFDLARPSNTFDAHRLLQLARTQGRQSALNRRLMTAYLAEGAVLSDLPTLQRLSQEAGLDAGDVERVLASDAFTDEVRADEAEAGRREVTAVPTFLVDDLLVIPGAQGPDSMLATLRRAWGRRTAA